MLRVGLCGGVVPMTTGSKEPDHTPQSDPHRRMLWEKVSHSPLHNLWDFQGVPVMVVLKRTYSAFMEDNLLSRAAELGYYFLFALFPTLISASAIFGIVARSTTLYVRLLDYLALVIPPSAMGLVMDTFNQTTKASSGGKITFGLVAALWSASVGFAAIQDTLNIVYKVKETRPYWKTKGAAILVTVLLSIVVMLTLTALLGGDLVARYVSVRIPQHATAVMAAMVIRVVGWVAAVLLLILLFSIIYYYAPDVQKKRWHWLTPGAALAILSWLVASIALRLYLHYFNSFSVTYGSLGGVIILLTWFYVTGLMLLLGAELNSEIAVSVHERQMKLETSAEDAAAHERAAGQAA